jgi:flagellar hook-associated protein 3 FlgL
MLTRVGDQAQSERIRAALLDIQDRVRTAQQSVATGKTASVYADMPREAGISLRTRSVRDQLDGFAAENQKTIDQMRAADGALGNIVALAERFRTLLVQRLNDNTGDALPLDVEARSMTSELAAQLNTRFDGRYLFSGSRTGTKPVELPPAPILAADPTLYYQGDEVVTTSRSDGEVLVAWGVRASAPAFAEFFAALGKAATAHTLNDRATLEVALDQAGTALDKLTELRSGLAANTARLEDQIESQRSASVYLADVLSRLEDTDIAAAMTQIAQDQTALEASYALVGRLSNLSLAEYLR